MVISLLMATFRALSKYPLSSQVSEFYWFRTTWACDLFSKWSRANWINKPTMLNQSEVIRIGYSYWTGAFRQEIYSNWLISIGMVIHWHIKDQIDKRWSADFQMLGISIPSIRLIADWDFKISNASAYNLSFVHSILRLNISVLPKSISCPVSSAWHAIA